MVLKKCCTDTTIKNTRGKLDDNNPVNDFSKYEKGNSIIEEK